MPLSCEVFRSITPKEPIVLYSLFPSSWFPFPAYELRLVSAHIDSISSLLIFAACRFAFVRSSLSARRHLLTWVFASLHMPIAFHRKPRAWHSSSIVMTSSQPCRVSAWWSPVRIKRWSTSIIFCMQVGMHLVSRIAKYWSIGTEFSNICRLLCLSLLSFRAWI